MISYFHILFFSFFALTTFPSYCLGLSCVVMTLCNLILSLYFYLFLSFFSHLLVHLRQVIIYNLCTVQNTFIKWCSV